jgi:hypothetical protein
MPARKIPRSVHEAARDKARAIAKTDAYTASRRQRKRVEMLFAHLSAKQSRASSPHVAKIGAGEWMSFASFLRFWAVAANRNSSLAPFGPRRRNSVELQDAQTPS